MKTKKINFKKVASILKVQKNSFDPFQDIVLNENEVFVTDIDTMFVAPLYTSLDETRQIDKTLLDICAPNEKNTTLSNPNVKQYLSDIFEQINRPENEYKNIWVTDQDIKHMINAIPFCSKDDLRPVMGGVFVNGEICATDAHKMYFANRQDKASYNDSISLNDFSFILPVQFVQLLKALKVNNANLEVSEKYVKLVTPEFQIYSRLIDGKFPNYKAVIPQNNPFQVTMEKKDIEKVLKVLKPIVNKTTKQVLFTFNNLSLSINATDLDRHIEQTETISISKSNLDQDDFSIAFNLDLFTQCLKPLSNEITLSFSAPNRGVLINENILLMPAMI